MRFEGEPTEALLTEEEKLKNLKRLSEDAANSSSQDQPDTTALSNLSINDQGAKSAEQLPKPAKPSPDEDSEEDQEEE